MTAHPKQSMPSPPGVDRITVTLSPLARADLRICTSMTGLNQTRTIARALTLLRHVSEAQDAGGNLQVVHADGHTEQVHLL